MLTTNLLLTTNLSPTVLQLLNYQSAGYPIVAINTVEERRLHSELFNALCPDPADAASIADTAVFFSISSAQQLKTHFADGRTQADSCAFSRAFDMIADAEEQILLVHDFQHIVKNGPAYRSLLDCVPALKSRGCMIVLIAPHWDFPPELEHDVAVIDHELPTRDELNAALETIVESSGVAVNGSRDAILDAAAGLTLDEAESAIALSLTTSNDYNPRIVEHEKVQLIKKSGYLEYTPPRAADDVGGLDLLKDYIRDEVLPVKNDEQLRVRGLLLVGVPGTGKSLTACAAGSLLQWPVLRLDVAALKGGLVGESEKNMRAALQLAEAVSPCVLWLDEIEKGIGGFASSASTDGGTTLGMVGQLLNWLQEHRKPILTIGTCNDYDKLPSELTRAGRFDERFFVDLPTDAERRLIADIHLARFSCSIDTADRDGLLDLIVEHSADWTGAEIEQLVKSVARRTGRKPTCQSIAANAKHIKPISSVKHDEIAQLRDWAETKLRRANQPKSVKTRPKRHVKTPSVADHMRGTTATVRPNVEYD